MYITNFRANSKKAKRKKNGRSITNMLIQERKSNHMKCLVKQQKVEKQWNTKNRNKEQGQHTENSNEYARY